MKNLWIFLMLLFALGLSLFINGCDNDCECETDYCSEEGMILDIDPRRCACCGGWFIEIGEDTLRALTLPDEFAQSLDFDEFPLPVYLEWMPVENLCLGDEIKVECIKRQ